MTKKKDSISAADGTRTARKGDTIQIQYICRSEDGKQLETTYDDGPAPTIVLGKGEVLKALEKAFVGMAAGEKKHVVLSPKDAFGAYDDELIMDVPPEKWQLDEPPQIGMEIELLDAPDDVADEDVSEDDIMQGIVIEINDGTAIVDCNHPLAGQTLVYDLELVRILSK